MAYNDFNDPNNRDSMAENNGTYINGYSPEFSGSPPEPDPSANWRQPEYPQEPASYNYPNEGAGAAYGAQANPESAPPSPGEPKKKKEKGGGFVKTACLCLVFTLVGSTVGAVAGSQITLHTANTSSAYTSSAGTPSVKTQSTESSAATVTPVAATGSEMSASDIYAMACQQVVGITAEITATNMWGQTSSSSVAGTGFFISEDGYIATNYHVVSSAISYGAPITVVLYNGDSYEAEYIGGDSDSDVAVLKIDATGMNAATFADSNNMIVGESIYVVGNALGELNYTMTSGLVSALDREITTTSDSGVEGTTNMFQIDAAVNSGNSGGPAYNSRGEVVGIVTAKYTSTGVEGLGFALPSNDVAAVINDLLEYGYVSGKPYAGLEVRTVESNVAEYYNMPVGAYVTSVADGGAADAAGIQVSDIITGLGETEITSASDLNAALKEYTAGDIAKITLYRGGSYLEMEITFDEKTGTAASTESSADTSGNTQYGFPFGSRG